MFGFTYHYAGSIEAFKEEMCYEEGEFVHDFLSMYRTLYLSWKNSEFVQETVNEQDVLFQGFNGNDVYEEGRYYLLYQFLVEDKGFYQEINDLIEAGKIEATNSHGLGPSMAKLRRMVEISKLFDEKRHKRNYLYYTKEEIEKIINA